MIAVSLRVIWTFIIILLLSTATIDAKNNLNHRYRMAVKSVLIPEHTSDKSKDISRMPPKRIFTKRSFPTNTFNHSEGLPFLNCTFDEMFEEASEAIFLGEQQQQQPQQDLMLLPETQTKRILLKSPVAVRSVEVLAWIMVASDKLSLSNRVFISSRDIWVTKHPDLKRFCKSNRPSVLRLAQLLGLPPLESILNKRYFVRISVPIGQLLKPCLQTLPRSQKCAPTYIRFPSKSRPPEVRYGSPEGPLITQDIDPWFFNLAVKTSVYKYWQDEISAIFPWTRLGYTHDWKTGRAGVDEYVIRRGTHVIVKSIQSFQGFCN